MKIVSLLIFTAVFSSVSCGMKPALELADPGKSSATTKVVQTGPAFQFPTICYQTDSRKDLNTFEKLEEAEITIPDSEVTII